MIKNIIKPLGVLLLATLIGCSDFLEENPETKLSETTAYNSGSALEAAIRGILNAFQDNSMYTHDMQEYMQTASCLVYFPQGTMGNNNSNERYYSSYHYAQSATTVLNNRIYANHYVGIARANKLLECLPDSPVEESYKTEIEAEARFLRAVLYFSLVRFYGDVPLLTRTPVSADDADKPRTNYAAVYRQILDDLAFAEEYMRSDELAAQVTPGESRPVKWAATAFKAAVYTQIGSYLSAPEDHAFGTIATGPQTPDFTACDIQTAEQAWLLAWENAMAVIEKGPYRLADRYTDLFRWTDPQDWQLKERIFVLTTSTAVNTGQLARRSLPQYPEGTANTLTRNSNWGRFRPTRFVFQTWCAAYDGEKGTGTNNSDIYVSCPDPRFNATFIHTRTTNLNTGSEYGVYPANSYIRSNNRQYYLPYFKKYLDPLYDANCGNADFYYMRYAEMYLIAAEAAASLCASPDDEWGRKAYDCIEVLHARARRTTTPEAAQPRWESGRFATRDELIAGVMWERVFEMYGEGHEWFDTHRRGCKWFLQHIIQPMNASLAAPEQTEARKWYGDNFLFPENPEEVRKGLFNAFPNDELVYNKALSEKDQNFYRWN